MNMSALPCRRRRCTQPNTWNDVMILKIFSPKNSAKKLAFLTQNKANYAKFLIITLVLEENANFFRQKLSKIAENCDHNIDPLNDSGSLMRS
jgi:predicted aldo/keto reductase-like oxidoreductase